MEYISASSVEIDSETFEPESLTVLQAARRSGVTQSAIIRWIRNGYLPATPSADGWQIPAEKLDAAHAAADESRGTGPVPRQTGPRLVPAPVELRDSLAVQAQEQPARLDVIGEALVSPLVELIRDQNDVVHDQAEVIGWLQAERSRLSAELVELQRQEQLAAQEPAPVLADEPDTSEDGHEDEVVSWLWNDSERPFEAQPLLFQPLSDADPMDPEPSTQTEECMAFQTRAAEHEPAQITAGAAAEPTSSPSVKGDDETWRDSWFVVSNEVDTRASRFAESGPAPILRPIVARGAANETAYNNPSELSQMIDETERKIAQMWRDEAELRSARPGATGDHWDDDGNDDNQAGFWQRLWPLKRRSS